MLKIKIFGLVILLTLTQSSLAAEIFLIKPTITATAIRVDSSTIIPYTVTNNSRATFPSISINPQFNTNAHVAILNNTCQSLTPGAICTFKLVIPGDHQPNYFTISPKICGFNETACSQSPAHLRLHVSVRTVDHPVRAYIGLTNDFLYRIRLVKGSTGILENGLPWFDISEPVGIAVNGPGTVAYVANTGTNQIFMIDTATYHHYYSYNLSATPTAVLVSPDESKLYVALSNGKVSVLGTDNGPFHWNINVGNAPAGLAISPDSTKLYVTNSADNTVAIANTAKAVVILNVPVGNTPFGIAATPDGTKIYVANSGSDSVSMINTSDYQVSSTIPVGHIPKGIAINPTSTQAYVANWRDGTISFIDIASNQVVATANVGAGPLGISVTPDGTQLYVTLDQTSAVAVVNISDQSVQYISTPAPQISMGNFIG